MTEVTLKGAFTGTSAVLFCVATTAVSLPPSSERAPAPMTISTSAGHLFAPGTTFNIRTDGIVVDSDAAAELKKAPHLSDLVNEARDALRNVFGPGTALRLATFVDPESDSQKSTIFLFVQTSMSATAASELLDRFDEAWWLDNVERAGNDLQISLEFV